MNVPLVALGRHALLILLCAVLLVACSDRRPPPLRAAAFGVPGPHAVGLTRHTVAHTDPETGSPRNLETVIWYPAKAALGQLDPARIVPRPDLSVAEGGPFPVAVFSHGSGGTPEQSVALTTHLASHGIIVLAPPHPGNTFGECFPCLDPAEIRASLARRPGDIQAVLDAFARLADDPSSPLHGALRLDHIGVIGHSLGGATAVLTAAQDDRVRVVVALAPAVLPEIASAATTLGVPLLIMNGDRDLLTPLPRAQALFERATTAEPRILVTLAGGDHLVFARLNTAVNAYVTAFLRLTLADDTRAASVFDPSRSLPSTRIEQHGLR
jgi:predicted dienelactone hydrolase